MTTPTGQISLDDVNIELSIAPGTQITMNQPDVRGLAEVPSGQISMSNLQGKSNAQFLSASGGTVSTVGDYKIHVFNSSGTFTVNAVGNPAGSDSVDYLVIAGGGAGVPPIAKGDNGSPSIFSSITSAGGGGGGGGELNRAGAKSGGCGGGAGNRNSTGYTGVGGSAGNTPPVSPPQGQPGGGSGIGGSASNPGGGGGGSGQAGAGDILGGVVGRGGDGSTTSITNSPVTYAGGGGGGQWSSQATIPGGSGGGGPNTYRVANDGTANLGGGGAASDRYITTPGTTSGSGGSGKVVLRYKFQ